MIVLSAQGIRKHYGPEPVLDGVTLEIHSRERISLVGPNGSGKTTLLRILAGKEEADGGSLEVHPSVAVGYLEQQPLLVPGRTLWEEARSALEHWFTVQHEAEQVATTLAQCEDHAEHQRLAARYDFLQQELHRHNAYHLDHKIERVLTGLGLRPEAFTLPIESLSGGEQNRLMLAKLLLAEPDVMLLDEPSNHLDIQATEWLETFLTETQAAIIVVSHDRYFLDRVATRTLELFHGTVESYPGNFSAYWRQKAQRLLVQRRTYQKQREEIEKAKDFIRRNAYGQKHAQAEDRRKKLARLEEELVAPPREISAPAMHFAEVSRSGDLVLRACGLTKGYDRPLFEDLTLEIVRGQRWAILGPNGSGKTTLLRCLLGQLTPDAGHVVLGQGVEIGYFDQHLACLQDEAAVVDAIRPERGEFNLQKRRDLLACFGLTGDTALQKVGQLSGGQRCRAALARLAASKANFLVLDEPTNHLDLWARDALERALRDFRGTVLLVSHDRYFIDQVADHLIVLEPGRCRVILGNYTVYRESMERGLALATADADKNTPLARPAAKAAPKKATKAAAKDDAQSGSRPKRRFPYRKVEQIEQDIHDREARIKELHELLARPETHRDGDRVRQIKSQIAQHQEALEQLYAHWEEAVELNW